VQQQRANAVLVELMALAAAAAGLLSAVG